MEYTNDTLKKIDEKRSKNRVFSDYLLKMAKEEGLIINKRYDDYLEKDLVIPKGDVDAIRFFNRSENIKNCLDYWHWDKYTEDKVLDLQSVNRCKNSRFCPNCKTLESAKYIHKITPIFEDMKKHYNFYFLTLTVPSIKTKEPQELKKYVDYIYKCFRDFKNYYSLSLDDKNAFQNRSINFAGGIRVLEITYNYKAGFHPHLHCIIVTEEPILLTYLLPAFKGKKKIKVSDKDPKVKDGFTYKNFLDCEIAKVWTLIFYKKFSHYNFENYNYDPKDKHPTINGEKREDMKNLEVDFRELDKDGLKETFKYTVKSSDITSYKVFKCLWHTLYRRRIRQGFGVLYGLKIDDCISDKEEEQLLPEELLGKTPEQLLIKEIKELYTTYEEYKKISRFTPKEEREILTDILKIDD